MTTSNSSVARRLFEEVWNGKRDDIIDEIFDPSCIAHLESWEVHGPDQFRNMRSEILESFPDLHLEVLDIIEDGDQVAVRWAAEATLQGTGFGMPATGNSVHFRGMTWLVIEGGRITRSWDAWNLSQVIQEFLYAQPGDEGAGPPASLRLLRKTGDSQE